MIAYGVLKKTIVSECQYELGFNGQKSHIFKTHLHLIMRIPLSFLIKIFIYGTIIAYYV